jgi:hypothetical protein
MEIDMTISVLGIDIAKTHFNFTAQTVLAMQFLNNVCPETSVQPMWRTCRNAWL